MADTEESTSWDPFEAMEKLEDEILLQELRGQVIEPLVYEFVDPGGRSVIGLSKAGVDWVAGEMMMRGEVLREIDFQLILEPSHVIAVVKVGRFTMNREWREVQLETAFGTRRQPRKKEIRVTDTETREEDDPFAIEIAMIKATRNAKRMLMPESFITRVIGMAWEECKVTRLESLEEPSTDPSMAALPKKADISRESFVFQARDRGYTSWKEILDTLKLSTAGELREMTYRKALERLPRKSRPVPDRDLPLEEELQDEDVAGFDF